MDLTAITYLIVGLTFALYIGIAIAARAGTTSEFYVAGKGVNPILNGMATAQIGCQQPPLYHWQVL